MKRWLKVTLMTASSFAGLFAGLCAIGYSTAETKKVLPTVQDDPSLPALTIDGIKLHLETRGRPESPVVVFLHGGPGNDYRHLLPLTALEDEFFLVFYDQRGAGLSERVDEGKISLDGFVQEVHLIGEKFSPGRPFGLVGHSWGGTLAATYADRHPDRVDRLALIEPGFLTREAFGDFVRAFGGGVPPFSLELVGTIWSLGWQALKIDGPDEDASLDHFFLSLAMSNVPGNPMAGYFCENVPKPDDYATWRMGVRSSISLQTSALDENKNLKFDFVGSSLKDWPHPSLIIAGDCNRIIGPAHQKRHHLPLLADPQLEVIHGTGHMMIEEKPKEVTALLRDYLHSPKTKVLAPPSGDN